MASMTVERVREMLQKGCTDTEIGAEFGTSRSTARRFRGRAELAPGSPAGVRRYDRAAHAAAPVAQKPGEKPITVADFLLGKRRAVCPVCQLKEPVKSLVLDAKKKGERQADIIEYLKVVHRVTVTPREFASHISGRHDG